jgi:cytoskeletal protein CcmA (bactofilin family)
MLRAGALTLLLGLLFGPFGERAWAQPPAAPPIPAAPAAPRGTPPAPPADSRQALHDALAAKYEVLAVYNGIVLKPRTEEMGVRTVEVSGDTIAVNGERVSEGVLRAWLGEQAEPILRLHRLAPAERQALFGVNTRSTSETEIPDTSAPSSAGSAEPSDSDESAETTEPLTTEEPETPKIPEAPAPPSSPSTNSGSRVKVIGGITVDRDELAEEAVAILGTVRVDGEVAEDAVAVGGSVVINGKVGGNVVAVGGGVSLGPHAEVMGDVTSVGGTIDREEGAKVHGSTQEVGTGGRVRHPGIDIDFWPFGPARVLWSLIRMIMLALLVFLCLLLGRRPVERAEHYLVTEPWKAAVVGLVAVFLFLPLLLVVTVLLIITIIGCALVLLYPFLAVLLALLLLVGYTASVHRLGVLLEQRFNRRFGSPYAVALMGLLAIEGWILFGKLLGLGGGILHGFGLIFIFFGMAAHTAAWIIGLGAVILDRLNGPAAAGAPAPLTTPAPIVSPPPPASYPPADPLPLSENWDEEEERRWEEPPPPEER